VPQAVPEESAPQSPQVETEPETSTSVGVSSTSMVAVNTKLTKAPTIRALSLQRGRSITAARIASAVSMSIPKQSLGIMRISIVKGNKYCIFVGKTIRGIKNGKCIIVVKLIPKRGLSTSRRTTMTVRNTR
jgi:hypothetical protein